MPTLLPLTHGGGLTVLQYCWGEQAPSRIEENHVRIVRHRILRRLGTGASLAHIAHGASEILRLAGASSIVIARSHLPAAMVLLAKALRQDINFCWDMDGFMPDERLDFGGWSARSPQYRALKKIEVSAIRRAQSVIVRTRRAKEYLAERTPEFESKLFVVGNGRDPQDFSPESVRWREQVRARWSIPPEALVLGYVGSLGPQYLPASVTRLVRAVIQAFPQAVFVVVSPDTSSAAKQFEGVGDSARKRFVSLPPDEVGRSLGALDIGLALRAESFSQRAVCPLKLGEFLLCGVPVIASRGVGDTNELAGNDAVLMWDAATTDDEVVAWVKDTIARREEKRARARECGLSHYSLSSAIHGYQRAIDASPSVTIA